MQIVHKFRNALIKITKIGVVSKPEMRPFIRDGAVIIESGAHVGVYTCELAQVFPRAHIHAFEPIPEIFEILKSATRKYSNVTCHKLALGVESGEAEFFVSSGTSDGSSSLLEPKEHLSSHPGVLFKEKVKVSVVNLDCWLENQKMKADFLWLDMQGLELAVLQSAPFTVANIQGIYTEVNLIENYRGGSLYPEMKQWLDQAGFEVAKEAIAWKEGGNVLFGRKSSQASQSKN